MNYRKIIQNAYINNYAIPHFNFDSLQMAKFILEECNEQNSPVFISVSTSAVKYFGGYNIVVSVINSLIKDLNIHIPAIIHLDHAKTIEECKSAIDAGFDSVMIDYSDKSVEENIASVNALRNYNSEVLIECEIGSIGKGNKEAIYADLDSCELINKNSEFDMLAPAIGTVHGFYTGEQKINIDILKEINNKVQKPLVLHGGSGTNPNILKRCIANGITKVNINTDLKVAWNKGVKEYISNNPDEIDYRKFIKNAEKYIKEVIRNYILLFDSKGRYKGENGTY